MNPEDLQHAKTFRDRIPSVTESGSRNWVYAIPPKGPFYTWRKYISASFLILFILLPFLHYDGDPLFLFNFPEGKFILFGKIFWPHDFFIFAVAMICFIIFISLFTVLYGRLFCGWACPQTVFMEFVFRKIEWWIEGSASQQLQLNTMPWNLEKLRKKLLKHIIFITISFLIANIFLAYIIGVKELYTLIHEPITNHTTLLAGIIIFTLLFYFVFSHVREIVCTTICPYGRLQSVLFDKDTMQISYDYSRGEPRAKISKKTLRTEGDCIDCKLCVQVCPTGIDIRNGVQMECVGCTACIDVCNQVMEKVSFPKGLIRYASENEISGIRKFRFNTRMKAYSTLLCILLVFMGGLIMTRKTIDAYVKRVPGQLYQYPDKDHISNLYTMKIFNKSSVPNQIDVRLVNPEGKIRFVGSEHLVLKPESVSELEFFVILDNSIVNQRSSKIYFEIYKENQQIQQISTNFLGPFKQDIQ
jgi:cytochrome c oxidase accessory protein FixG